MTNETKARIRAALQTAYSNATDNAARARHTFGRMDAKALNQQYDESGRTCSDLLADYEKEERDALTALKEFDPEWAPQRMFTKER